MVVERKTAPGTGPQTSGPAAPARQPGRANRGFRSMDPERQPERSDEGGLPPSRSATAQPQGDAPPPRDGRRDDPQRLVRRTGTPGPTRAPGSG